MVSQNVYIHLHSINNKGIFQNKFFLRGRQRGLFRFKRDVPRRLCNLVVFWSTLSIRSVGKFFATSSHRSLYPFLLFFLGGGIIKRVPDSVIIPLDKMCEIFPLMFCCFSRYFFPPKKKTDYAQLASQVRGQSPYCSSWHWRKKDSNVRFSRDPIHRCYRLPKSRGESLTKHWHPCRKKYVQRDLL